MWLSNILGEGQGELAEPRTFRPCSGAAAARRAGCAPGSSFLSRINPVQLPAVLLSWMI